MKKIYKYPLIVDDAQLISLHGKILSVGVQNNILMLWAVYDDQAPERIVRITIRGTGHSMKDVDESNYIATVMDGPFVWHVFATEEE